jgi:TM2 domain-containing membrane protein YozV
LFLFYNFRRMFKKLQKIVLLAVFLLCCSVLEASFIPLNKQTKPIEIKTDIVKIQVSPPDSLCSNTCKGTVIFHKTVVKKTNLDKKKKILSAICAFPFPFGMIGLHRVYMGSAPYVPLIYIASLGGAMGILPLIDFIVILLKKDISPYQNNSNVFMWVEK